MANTASLNAIVRSSAVPSATSCTYRARADPNSVRHDDHARPWLRLAMAGRIDAVPGFPLGTTGLCPKALGNRYTEMGPVARHRAPVAGRRDAPFAGRRGWRDSP